MRWLVGALGGLALWCWAGAASGQVVVHTVSLTTNASGAVTAYAPTTFGTVLAIRYVPDATNPLANGATLTITDSTTGLTVLDISTLGAGTRDFAPRMFTMTTTGTVAFYASGGTNVLAPVPVAGPVKVVVASGGNAKSGTVYVFVGGR